MTKGMAEAVIEVATKVIITIREADNLVNNVTPVHAAPISGGSVLKQPIFDWKLAE